MPEHTKQILGQGDPWWAPLMVKLVGSLLTRRMDVFEYGSGASSVWLAERCGTLTTVEHDQSWAESVAPMLPHTARLLLRDRPYAAAIDGHLPRYDLIVVDGRDRVDCVLHSLQYLKAGGYFLLDDSERERYQVAVKAMKRSGWQLCVAEQPIHGHIKKALLVNKPK